jgi:hypothetical protein
MEETTTPITPVAPTESKPVEVTAPEVKTPEASTLEPETTKSADPLLDGYYLTNPFFHDLANFFGVEQRDFSVAKDKLSVIADWAYKESKDKSAEDVLMIVRKLEDRIQPAEWGERRYSNVYKYVRLASRRQSLDQAMHAFEKEIK